MKVEITEQVDKAWWNSLVSSVPEGTIFQTVQWADFLKEYVKYEPLYLIAKSNSAEIKAILLFFKTAFNHRSLLRMPFSSLAISLFKRFIPNFTWLGGPIVFASGEEKIDIYNFVLEEVARRAEESKGARIEDIELSHHDPELIEKGVIPINGYESRKWATYLLDLSFDEETLWKNLRKKGRWSVKTAKEQGIYVERIGSLEELYDYYLFTKKCAEETGRRGFPSFGNLSVMWRYLHPEGNVELFVAKQDDRKLSELGIWAFNGIIYQFGNFQSKYSFDNKLRGGDLIKWEIIKWGHEKGYRIYDLAGVNPNPTTEKEANIRMFKEKWGGRYVEFGEYSKPLENKLFSLVKLENKLLSLLVKAKGKLWRVKSTGARDVTR